LIPTLLPRLGVRVPPFSAIELTESTFPVPVEDFHTDLVVLLRGAQAELLLVALVEVQLAVSPELAVLSLLAHASRANRTSFRAANEALATLDPDQASLYLDLLYRTMGPALFRALEESMIVSKPYSGLFEKYYREGIEEGKAEGIAEGKAEGIAEGKAEGIAEGKAEGIAEGLAEALLRVLTARSLTPSPQQRSTILACADPRRVERWIERALRATSVEEALREE
jgi:hypothetical protein